MRQIHINEIIENVRNLSVEINTTLSEDIVDALKKAQEIEESSIGKEVLGHLLENIRIAREESLPICQDTGLAVIFVEMGQDVHIVGGDLKEAINEGVRQGYKEGYLRKSVLDDPILRKNTGDNTPAIIHVDVVPGDSLKIKMAAKGGGSENSSAMKMMKPSDGVEGIKGFVLDVVNKAWANPCPPIIVGLGIGGNFEMAPILAKKALFRHLGDHNPAPHLAKLESELLAEVNRLGIGPEGFGGTVTALAVHVEAAPCHIASLPVAVNIDCHVSRHREIVI
ncbi:MAG: fumarate hydratase [Deltaproteobacteria bacterium]|nr:fumarate hydratase [Deltaproteobacteria bacterium]